MRMKNFLLTNLIAGTFAVGTFYVPDFFDRVNANDQGSANTSSSSIKVESNTSSQGNSSVRVKQTVRSNNNEVEVYTYREENGKVLEDNRRTIRSETERSAAENQPDSDQLRRQTRERVQNQAEAALKNFEEKLKQAEIEITDKLTDAEQEIATEKQEAEKELDQISQEAGEAETELRLRWQRQLEEREESFWQRLRHWLRLRIESLR